MVTTTVPLFQVILLLAMLGVVLTGSTMVTIARVPSAGKKNEIKEETPGDDKEASKDRMLLFYGGWPNSSDDDVGPRTDDKQPNEVTFADLAAVESFFKALRDQKEAASFEVESSVPFPEEPQQFTISGQTTATMTVTTAPEQETPNETEGGEHVSGRESVRIVKKKGTKQTLAWTFAKTGVGRPHSTLRHVTPMEVVLDTREGALQVADEASGTIHVAVSKIARFDRLQQILEDGGVFMEEMQLGDVRIQNPPCDLHFPQKTLCYVVSGKFPHLLCLEKVDKANAALEEETVATAAVLLSVMPYVPRDPTRWDTFKGHATKVLRVGAMTSVAILGTSFLMAWVDPVGYKLGKEASNLPGALKALLPDAELEADDNMAYSSTSEDVNLDVDLRDAEEPAADSDILDASSSSGSSESRRAAASDAATMLFSGAVSMVVLFLLF